MIVSACTHANLRPIHRIGPTEALIGLIQFRWGKAGPRSDLGEPVRRPGLRPTLSPVAHSLRSNRVSDGRQGPEPQALTGPLPRLAVRFREKTQKNRFSSQKVGDVSP
jgi:hypothetical protein